MRDQYHQIPPRDPVDGHDLYVSELTGERSGVTLRGKFRVPVYSRLTDEHRHFLETFLRCRGNLSAVEKELGISYPTVRGRLDAMLKELGMHPKAEAAPPDAPTPPSPPAPSPETDDVLGMLERGEITPEEAKSRLGGSR